MITDRNVPDSAIALIRAGIRIGGVVRVPGHHDRLGTVEKVGIDRRTGAVIQLLVRTGRLRHHNFLLPITVIDSAGSGIVRLHDPAADMSEIDISPEATGMDDVLAADRVLIGRKTRVEAADGVLGSIYKVLIDPLSLKVTHLVLRKRGLLGRLLVVAVDSTARISAEAVRLSRDTHQLETLEEYMPDGQLAERVVAALKQYPYVRRLLQGVVSFDSLNSSLPQGGTVRVAVQDGVVVLQGNVESHGYARTAEWFARRVRGVRAVLNLLVADADLQVAVAAALGQDPRTRSLQRSVSVDLGRVTLVGNVPAGHNPDIATEVAAAVQGVRAVVNRLRVGF